MTGIDLAAYAREFAHPEGIPITVTADLTILAPAEFPIDVLDPLLSDDFDLVGVVKSALEHGDTSEIGPMILGLLLDRPTLPADLIKALHDCLEILFGQEQYAKFRATRPGIKTIAFLITGLLREYGVGLGEASPSLESAVSDGETSKPISNEPTESTLEASTAAPEPVPASSESDASLSSDVASPEIPA